MDLQTGRAKTTAIEDNGHAGLGYLVAMDKFPHLKD